MNPIDVFVDALDRLGLNPEAALMALLCTALLGAMLAHAMFSKEGRS